MNKLTEEKIEALQPLPLTQMDHLLEMAAESPDAAIAAYVECQMLIRTLQEIQHICVLRIVDDDSEGVTVTTEGVTITANVGTTIQERIEALLK